MPYKKVIKVSDEVFGKLRKIMNEYGFPSPNQVIVFLLNMFESWKTIYNVMINGKTPYYTICPECFKLAHFLRTASKGAWYYCPKCGKMFKVEGD